MKHTESEPFDTIRFNRRRADASNIACGRAVVLDAFRAAATPTIRLRRLPPLRLQSVPSVPRPDPFRHSSIAAAAGDRLADTCPAEARLAADTADSLGAERSLTGRRHPGACSRRHCRGREDSPGPTGPV